MKKRLKKVSNKNRRISWNERTKRFSYHDIKHIKFASVAFAFFLVAIWEGLRVWLGEIHWAWFLGLMILFSVKPFINFWKKK